MTTRAFPTSLRSDGTRGRHRLLAAALVVAGAAGAAGLVSSTPAEAASAQAPELALPFRCNTTWRASTYSSVTINGVTHVHGNAVDFNVLVRNSSGTLVLGNDRGLPVVAAAAGRVASSSGGTVVIDHGGGWRTLYAHMGPVQVAQGQFVSQGQWIGAVNRVGFATGDHLHFELRRDGVAVLPTFDGVYANVSASRTQDFTSTNCLPGEHGLWFANSLLRAPDGTIDWVTPSGDRYWVPNQGVLSCLRASGASLRDVSWGEFNANPRNRLGDPGGRWADCTTWAVGWMVKGSGPAVWYVAPNGFRYHVQNATVVMQLGGWSAVRPISDALLGQIPANPWGVGAGLQTPLFGELVRGSGTAAVYFVGPRGTRYWVPSGTVVNCNGGWAQVAVVRNARVTSIPASPSGITADCDAPLLDRLIRRSDGQVDYVTDAKVRHWVPNGSTVGCLGGWGSTIHVDTARFDRIPRDRSNTWATCSTKW